MCTEYSVIYIGLFTVSLAIHLHYIYPGMINYHHHNYISSPYYRITPCIITTVNDPSFVHMLISTTVIHTRHLKQTHVSNHTHMLQLYNYSHRQYESACLERESMLHLPHWHSSCACICNTCICPCDSETSITIIVSCQVACIGLHALWVTGWYNRDRILTSHCIYPNSSSDYNYSVQVRLSYANSQVSGLK